MKATFTLVTLFHLVNCSVYNVQSVDDFSCLQHQECNTLDYYLMNSSKIFASNAKVFFNPGIHYLENTVVVKNTYNMSLLGITSNGSTAQIVCLSNFKTAGIILVNTTNIIIHNLVFINCSVNGESLFNISWRKKTAFDGKLTPLPVTKASLIVVDSTDLQLQKVTINNGCTVTGLLCVNIWGSSHFESVHSTGLEVYYTRTVAGNKTTLLTIDQYQPLVLTSNYTVKQLLQILAFKCASKINIKFSNIMFTKSHSIIIGLTLVSKIKVIFDNCLFANADVQKVTIYFPPKEGLPLDFTNIIQFVNCEFKYNNYSTILMIYVNNTELHNCQVDIINSTFKQNSHSILVSVELFLELVYSFRIAATLLMQNVTIEDIDCQSDVISFENTLLQLKEQIRFVNIQSAHKTQCSGILYGIQSEVVVYNYLEFFQNKDILNLVSLQDTYYIKMIEGSLINISNNIVKHNIFRALHNLDNSKFPLCFFQFCNEQSEIKNITNTENYSVTIYNNTFTTVFGRDVKLAYCAWLDDSAFSATPYDVNLKIIHLTNSSGSFPIQKDIKQLCYCTNDTHYDCMIDELGPLYPGQTLSTKFAFVWNDSQAYTNEGYMQNCIKCDNDDASTQISAIYLDDYTYFDGNFPQKGSEAILELVVMYFEIKMKNSSMDVSDDAKEFILSYLYGKFNRKDNNTIDFYDTKDNIISVVNEISNDECSVVLNKEKTQRVRKSQCTPMEFTILANGTDRCTLYLLRYSKLYSLKVFDAYSVKLLSCPIGFMFDAAKGCICDPTLTAGPLSITKCSLDGQSVLRPANSWIQGHIDNTSGKGTSHNYLVSEQCPFDYCIPHSSYLNLSSPHLQCQFNRTGLLCGKCHPSLSAVFGSSQCQQCSNVYLLIVVPLAITGVLLVFLMFFLNLTITDGDIIPFIFYSNIVSINSAIFFPQNASNHPAYVLISLANLDLGISMCFYDGMDDYAKMWFQLLYPGYLTCIAATLIVASRYMSKVQKITAQRALPVLATLFMLSYTKILRMVCSVVFTYTMLTRLPSLKTTVAWSVDANITLFGAKFTILFVVCIVIFLILIPFIAILTFTRLLSQLKMIHHFKPLLDAFQGPYKTGYYYWPGLQVTLRAIFFGLSALEKNLNLMLGITLLVTSGYLHGMFSVYKSSYKNYNELLILLNMVALLSVHTQDSNSIVVVNMLFTLAAIQFCFIVMYHVITFAHNGWSLNKLQPLIDKCKRFQWSENGGSIRNNIALHNVNAPDVTYNYTEFREPLAGHDF